MTYKEEIEIMILDIRKLYLQAERIRDSVSSCEEKEYWNKVRGILFGATEPLHDLYDTMDNKRRQKL